MSAKRRTGSHAELAWRSNDTLRGSAILYFSGLPVGLPERTDRRR